MRVIYIVIIIVIKVYNVFEDVLRVCGSARCCRASSSDRIADKTLCRTRSEVF